MYDGAAAVAAHSNNNGGGGKVKDTVQQDFKPVTIIYKTEDMPTIADRGTSVDIVSFSVAQQLVQEGIVEAILAPREATTIQFGTTSARSAVVGRIMGKGLIGEVLVVDNDLPIMLFSDITLTEKGTRLIQDDTMLFGVAAGRVVVVGTRDNTAPRTSTESMWMMNLRQLMTEADPRDRAREHDNNNDLSARQIVDFIIAQPPLHPQ